MYGLTEEDKAELLGTLVEEMEVKTKDRVLLRLAPFAEVGGLKLAINSQMGAGVRLELTTFGLCLPLPLSRPLASLWSGLSLHPRLSR